MPKPEKDPLCLEVTARAVGLGQPFDLAAQLINGADRLVNRLRDGRAVLLASEQLMAWNVSTWRAGTPTTVAPAGTSSTTTALAPIEALAPTAPADHLSPSDPDLALDRCASTSPARKPIVTNGAIVTPEWISTRPSATT